MREVIKEGEQRERKKEEEDRPPFGGKRNISKSRREMRKLKNRKENMDYRMTLPRDI
jgi:hypothetical protein